MRQAILFIGIWSSPQHSQLDFTATNLPQSNIRETASPCPSGPSQDRAGHQLAQGANLSNPRRIDGRTPSALSTTRPWRRRAWRWVFVVPGTVVACQPWMTDSHSWTSLPSSRMGSPFARHGTSRADPVLTPWGGLPHTRVGGRMLFSPGNSALAHWGRDVVFVRAATCFQMQSSKRPRWSWLGGGCGRVSLSVGPKSIAGLRKQGSKHSA